MTPPLFIVLEGIDGSGTTTQLERLAGHLAARGLTLFDVAPGRVEKDLEQWEGICRWLDK